MAWFIFSVQASAMADSVPIPTQSGKSMVSLQAQATVQEAQATLNRLQEVARLSGGKVPSAPLPHSLRYQA